MLCISLIKIWNLANHMRKQNKKHLNTRSMAEKLKTKRVWCSLFHFSHVIWKISNYNMWTAKHLAQASCTELSLKAVEISLICGPLSKISSMYLAVTIRWQLFFPNWKFTTVLRHTDPAPPTFSVKWPNNKISHSDLTKKLGEF